MKVNIMKKLALIISVIVAASTWATFGAQAQEAQTETQNTHTPCPMGFERPANCPMMNSQNTGPQMRGFRGGAGGPMMGGQRHGMSGPRGPQAQAFNRGPQQGWAARGPGFAQGPRGAQGPKGPMMGGPRQGMSAPRGLQAQAFNRGPQRGWDAEAPQQGWAPRGPRAGWNADGF